MAAPYRANHQHKVKAHTSEASKRYMAKPCRSLRQSLYRCKPAKRCRKAIEELQKNQLQSGAGAECSAPLLLQKMFELFGGDHFFLFK
ncbi:MAG: hypothetical protein EGR82_12030 [Ruminococcus bicirculans]|nr:hypothetical protein [Ruminococcus bicirculans (ex Wegman et al. 2014)]